MRKLAPLVAVALAACHGGPRILFFGATPSTAYAGEAVELAWQVRNADSVSLAPGGPVIGDHQVVAPAATTTYVLTARRGSDSVRSEVTVTVSPSAVLSFRASPSIVAPGAPTTLSWELARPYTTAITENGGPEMAAPGASFVAHPGATSIYRLVLHGTGAQPVPPPVPLLVRVAPYSNAVAFAASPASLQQGDRATLSWQVDPAGPPPSSWTLLAHPDTGADTRTALLGGARSAVVEPVVGTTYSLVANGPAGAQPAPPQVRVPVSARSASGLTYAAPAAGAALSLVATGCAGAGTCQFSVVANQALTLRGLAFDLPLDAAKVSVAQQGSSVFQEPTAHVVTLGTAGRLAGTLVFGSSRLAGASDVAVPAGGTVATFSLAVVPQGGAGTVFGPGATADKRFRLAVHPAQPLSLAVGTLTVQ